eukprot:scaffold29778_cov62-Phaeocystis_antarctica.AAC.5
MRSARRIVIFPHPPTDVKIPAQLAPPCGHQPHDYRKKQPEIELSFPTPTPKRFQALPTQGRSTVTRTPKQDRPMGPSMIRPANSHRRFMKQLKRPPGRPTPEGSVLR